MFGFQDLGTVGRLFGALISKAGIPVPTEITQKVLTAAQHIGQLSLYLPLKQRGSTLAFFALKH